VRGDLVLDTGATRLCSASFDALVLGVVGLGALQVGVVVSVDCFVWAWADQQATSRVHRLLVSCTTIVSTVEASVRPGRPAVHIARGTGAIADNFITVILFHRRIFLVARTLDIMAELLKLHLAITLPNTTLRILKLDASAILVLGAFGLAGRQIGDRQADFCLAILAFFALAEANTIGSGPETTVRLAIEPHGVLPAVDGSKVQLADALARVRGDLVLDTGATRLCSASFDALVLGVVSLGALQICVVISVDNFVWAWADQQTIS